MCTGMFFKAFVTIDSRYENSQHLDCEIINYGLCKQGFRLKKEENNL